MMLSAALACLLVASVAVQGQVFKTCPGPKLFEARMNWYDKERQFYVRGAMAYDEANRRISEFEDETYAGNRTVYRKLKMWNTNKEYIVDLKTKNCTVVPVRGPWHTYGAPSDAKLVFDATIGAVGIPNEHFMVAVFESQQANYTFSVTVSEPSCYPIHTQLTKIGKDGKSEMEVRDFYDGREGVKNPHEFDIPIECHGL